MASEGPRPTTQLGMTIGRHRIERLIGGGAMGRVFVCRTQEDRVVAIKLLRSSHAAAGDKLMEKRAALEKVRSPNIVEVYDVSVYNNTPYVVMELAEGGTLAERIQQGPLRTVDALGHAREIAEGARAAWAQGIAHGDLRPHNVLLVSDHVKLVDFLLAPPVEGAPGLRGTPAYMAPELMLGTPADALSDIYALGTMLFECLTGRTPYTGSAAGILQQQSAPAPITLRTAMPGAPHFLVELVDRLLEKDRARRMKTWDEVLEGIARAMRGLSMKEQKPQLPDVDVDVDVDFDSSFDDARTEPVHTSAAAKDLLDSLDEEVPPEPPPPARAPVAPAPAVPASARPAPVLPSPLDSPWVHRSSGAAEPVAMSIEELALPEPPPAADLDPSLIDVDEDLDEEVLENESTRIEPGITTALDALGDMLGSGARPKPKKP